MTPAAHYWMGGIRTDEDGRTSVEGLGDRRRAHGVHGANGSCSNSLLESLVFAWRRPMHSMLRGASRGSRTRACRGVGRGIRCTPVHSYALRCSHVGARGPGARRGGSARRRRDPGGLAGGDSGARRRAGLADASGPAITASPRTHASPRRERTRRRQPRLRSRGRWSAPPCAGGVARRGSRRRLLGPERRRGALAELEPSTRCSTTT
ncbi:MAG: FAD-binding protein [Schumannella sp.]